MNSMVIAALVIVLIALVLAWLSALALYLEVQLVLRVFPAAHHLVRAHVDYLLMAALLGLFVLLADRENLVLPMAFQWAAIVGAIWNPFGFIVLAVTGKKRPDPGWMTWATLVAFAPATLGFGASAIYILRNV